MIDLTKRSYEKELMDRDDIAFSDMAQTLRELNVVNTRLGGARNYPRRCKTIIKSELTCPDL